MPDVREFGARGDGTADDTAALQHALDKGDGRLNLQRAQYRITRPLRVAVSKIGPVHINGHGGLARIIMDGPGPAFHLVGTHVKGSALPASIADGIWQKERLPTITGIEIVGQHAEADGIRIEGAMQPTLHQVLIRKCRHGVHLSMRDRNVLISDCHIYDNSGIGIFLDRLNLHQVIIHGNHISYCKQGGIRISESEIRNIQICSNDIEYNFDLKAESSADVLFDCRKGTVREGTIVGNTIQASQSPGGANVRLLGSADHPNAVGLLAITGNLLGSQSTVLDLHACRGVSITGNSIYSGYQNAIVAEDSEHLVLSGNSIDHNPEYRGQSTDRIVIRRSRNINLTGVLVQHTRPASTEVASSVDISESQNVNIVGCQVIGARTRGIALSNCTMARIADCTIRGTADDRSYRAAVSVDDKSRHVMIANNFLGRGSDGELKLAAGVGSAIGNMMVD